MENKQLKFRAWTGAQMEYNITVGKFGAFYVNPGSKGDGLDEKDSACLTQFNTKYPDFAPVMQYTGLKDKNGKEIYEGDIIVKNEYPFFDEGKPNYVGLVEWIFGGWQVVLKCVNKDKHGISDGINAYIDEDGEEGRSFEVIGNVFENSNLLNK